MKPPKQARVIVKRRELHRRADTSIKRGGVAAAIWSYLSANHGRDPINSRTNRQDFRLAIFI